jgi:uncharacterized membrane protein (DUF373 family)
MKNFLDNPSAKSDAWLSRAKIVRILETIQDLIVISLCIGLFCFMVLELREMFLSLLPPLEFQQVTADILFLIILVELFRLLIIYLQEQRVSIGTAVEVSIGVGFARSDCARCFRNLLGCKFWPQDHF